ncbi:DUF3667 domain-containing protein [Brevundimonas sp.]|uniref:DUF3667 domain-containing protein n=1 Tax=Brevundimonas sp. TaxID=1871086 RepID=UPI002B5F4148|nr:DUF3667 domain-containing protein [Brevundimonas sp.]HWQ86077.1 DUF3667 domain-containing protein [Brevundimonas sp.]
MAIEQDPSTGGSACQACGVDLAGRYCHGCGQDTEARPRPLREMVEEALSETTLIDSRLARTVVALMVAPGRLLVGYRDGAGGLYVSPIKIFVVMTALFLAVLNFSDVALYQFVRRAPPDAVLVATPDPDGTTVHVSGVVDEDRWMMRRIEPAIDPRIAEATRAAVARASDPVERANLESDILLDEELARGADRMLHWLPNALWLLMPLHALLLAPLFGRRRLFMEHLVFAMWAHATAFGLLMLLALANRFHVGPPAWVIAAPYLIYFVLAARRYYDMSAVSALWRGLVHTALYVMLVLLPAATVVMAAGLAWSGFQQGAAS